MGGPARAWQTWYTGPSFCNQKTTKNPSPNPQYWEMLEAAGFGVAEVPAEERGVLERAVAAAGEWQPGAECRVFVLRARGAGGAGV